MKKLTEEWVSKAEGDLRTAERELAAGQDPNYDAVCFHAQQCVEKYLKACLNERDVVFEKSHNLLYLLDLVVPFAPQFDDMRVALNLVGNYAIAYRYPGESADRDTADTALAIARDCSTKLRHFLQRANG